MRRIPKLVLLAAGIGLTLAGVVLLSIHLPQKIQEITERENIQKLTKRLYNAPWQGVHYLPQTNEWRFYAITGETRHIELGAPVDLVKVYYLDKHGQVTFTWAAARISLSARKPFLLADLRDRTGQLVAMRLMGSYVNEHGVNWDGCRSEFCQEAQRFDTLIVLDDQGTGITNGFIRYGWLPPTYPMYGFLCWQIEPVNNGIGHPVPIKEVAQ